MYKKHGIQPKAREIRSMLHMLSKSKDQEKGDRWEASLALLRDAQETELRLTEVSYNTGLFIVCCVRSMSICSVYLFLLSDCSFVSVLLLGSGSVSCLCVRVWGMCPCIYVQCSTCCVSSAIIFDTIQNTNFSFHIGR